MDKIVTDDELASLTDDDGHPLDDLDAEGLLPLDVLDDIRLDADWGLPAGRSEPAGLRAGGLCSVSGVRMSA